MSMWMIFLMTRNRSHAETRRRGEEMVYGFLFSATPRLRVKPLNITTPAFLVDRTIVEQNCARMRAKARSSGVAFRPHVKTHKTIEVGRMQHGGAPGPITV